MKKILGLALAGIMCAALAGCTTAGADGQSVPLASVDESVSLKDGYYTNDNDESYIRIEGNKIELCGVDIDALAEEEWEQLNAGIDDAERERQAPHHDSFIKNTVEDTKKTFALQEYTPVTFSLPNDHKSTVLALNYEKTKDYGSYEGYSLQADNSIIMIGNTYRYYGTELPQ